MLEVKPSWKKWRLITHKGRHFWAFKPGTDNIDQELSNIDVPTLSTDELQQFYQDFAFDAGKNPNAADKVFRNKKQNQFYNAFSGVKPELKNAVPEHQQALDALIKGINFFSFLQSDEGHWPGDYGGPMFLLPGLLIAAYLSESRFPKAHEELIKIYILNHQNQDGGWGMHIESESSMFGTVMQYVSLRILGLEKNEDRLVRARNWIIAQGGATGIPSWGKFYLAIMNLYDWSGFNSLFPEMWLFPKWLPFHPSNYWCHSRMVYLPMAYCYAQRIQAPENELILSLREEIFVEQFDKIYWPAKRNEVCEKDSYTAQSPVLKWMNFITNSYEKVHSSWLRKKALSYILDYIHAEDLQTDYLDIGPVSQAINSICIWHAEGKSSDPFQEHVKRWFDYLWLAEDGLKMSGYNGSQLWDVAFTSRAILESDIGLLFKPTIEKSYQFINESQIVKQHSSHERFFRHPMIGSWPFSTAEQGWPVADCTAEGLTATLTIHHSGLVKPKISEQRLMLAVDVILSFQNQDGGWATYELSRAPKWLEKLNPSEIFADIMIDYSWTECSSACIQTLIEIQNDFPDYKKNQVHSAITRGLQFVIQRQKTDGSWYGGWAVCFTYATWFGIEVLSKAKAKGYGEASDLENAIAKAANFLMSKQKQDGGWGETYQSCASMVYTEADQSQVVNTAWALLAMMAAGIERLKPIEKGIQLLINRQTDNGDWLQEGISGVFNYNCMITYSNYRNIFPIWALNRYYKEFIC